MAHARTMPEEAAANEVVRVRCRSEVAEGLERARWEVACPCGQIVGGESPRARIPPLVRCSACDRLIVLLDR